MSNKIGFHSRHDTINMLHELLDHGVTEIESSFAYISISDNEEEREEMQCLFDELGLTYLALDFQDVDEITDGSITDEKAMQILRFVDENAHMNFYVHCFAGISRSGAIAKFINEYFDADNPYLSRYVGHNRMVFNKLQAAAGLAIAAFYEELERQERSDPV